MLRQLPHKEAFSLCDFWMKCIVAPLEKNLISYLNIGDLSCSLQMAMTHYPKLFLLDWHQDKGFLMGLIGPNAGIKYKRSGSEQRRYIELKEGEIFVYTDFQFGEYLSPFAKELPQPISHAVEAEAGRMSIILNCFTSLATPSGF